MNKTKIEWVKNPDGTQGYTWNPITGCLNGCAYCYARKLANGRLKSRYLANHNVPPIDTEEPLTLEQAGELQTRLLDPFYPRFWPERLLDPDLESKKPKGIFPVDMGEWQADWVPIEWSHSLIGIIVACPQHRFYLLTHQPQSLNRFSPFPDNCWVGVTATDAKMARNALHELLRVEAKVKYISFEPLLERIYIDCAVGLDWVIIGAQTKPYKPPRIEWVEEIVRAADKAGIPVFLKNNLENAMCDIPLNELENYTFWDKVFHDGEGEIYGFDLRQEMPDGQ